jgi:hypothetical protein
LAGADGGGDTTARGARLVIDEADRAEQCYEPPWMAEPQCI